MPADTRDDRLDALETRLGSFQSEVREFQTEVRAEFVSLEGALRRAIRDSEAETRRLMRVLHEEVLDRIQTLGEAR